MQQLEGRTAFITGGAQGIGLGIARAFARAGMQVAIVDIDEQALEAARGELEPLTKVSSLVLDVRDRAAFAQAADDVERELGPVSVVCNNAGVAGGVAPHLATYEDWDWVLGVNLDGVVNGVQTFLPRLVERGGGGHIVNTSSGAGLVSAGAGFLYTMSKFAVVGLSESLHAELAPFGIGVSVLCPGRVATAIVENSYQSRPGALAPEPMREAALQAASASLQSGTSPDAVGEMVVRGIREGALYVITDNEIRPLIQPRTDAILAAIPDREPG